MIVGYLKSKERDRCGKCRCRVWVVHEDGEVLWYACNNCEEGHVIDRGRLKGRYPHNMKTGRPK
jgi:hypothetical protein